MGPDFATFMASILNSNAAVAALALAWAYLERAERRADKVQHIEDRSQWIDRITGLTDALRALEARVK